MKVIIRTNTIVNCWNTKDVFIIETSNGKKWVCEGDENSVDYVEQNKDKEFIVFELKGKGRKYGEK